MKAVESIPCYVAAASLMVVLVPRSFHVDRKEICSYASWSYRGWCIAEFQARCLAEREGPVMILLDGQTEPFMVRPRDGLMFRAGRGNFTCCSKGHIIDGVPIGCDRAKVRDILVRMVSEKVCALEGNNRFVEARCFRALRPARSYKRPKPAM